MSTARIGRLVLAVLTAAATLLGTVEVQDAAARGYGGAHCYMQKHRVRRGEHDRAMCTHGLGNHSGVAYTVQREVHRVGRKGHKHREVVRKRYTLADFRTDKAGTALIRFTVPRALHYGVHTIVVKVATRTTTLRIRVVRR